MGAYRRHLFRSPSRIASQSLLACCVRRSIPPRRWPKLRQLSDECRQFRNACRASYALGCLGLEAVTMARVLVIDDDQPVRATITVVLEAGGFEVVAVERGRAGLKELAAPPPGATAGDLFMPWMDLA